MSVDKNAAKIAASMSLLESVQDSMMERLMNNCARQHSNHNMAKRIAVVRDMLLDVQKNLEGRT